MSDTRCGLDGSGHEENEEESGGGGGGYEVWPPQRGG